MELTGQVKGCTMDWVTGKWELTFTINEEGILKEQYDNIAGFPSVDIKISKHRKKRSLDANAYMWVLLQKMSAILNLSSEELYEQMLRQYGTFYQDEEGYVVATFPAKVDIKKIQGHWKFYKSNGRFNSYLMIKGSSEYDTKEMSVLLDGVVNEAKEMGIETLTPDEIERMKQSWQGK